MRRLILLRHADAGLNPGGTDAERLLTARGREQAAWVGHYLRHEGLLPDLALVSSARRTQETWDHVQAALGPAEIRVEPQVYNAPPERLQVLVEAVEPAVRTLLLVGHNPGVEELAKALVGTGDRYASARMRQKFPPAALAVIDFAIEEWTELVPGEGRLDRFVEPEVRSG
jgi:phosphohistidine phosphatase